MFAIRMSNQSLNPTSYSQIIGWFAWNCRSEVKHHQNNFFHLKLLGKFDLDAFQKTVSKHFMKFRSWLGSLWAAKCFRSERFQHNDPISLASRATKLFRKNPLQQSEHATLKNTVLQQTRQNFMQNYSANVTLLV